MIFHLIIRLPPAGFALLPTAVLVEWSVPTMFLTCFALLSAHDLNPCHHIVQKNNMIIILFIRLPPAGFALLPTAVLVEWSVPTMFLTCFALLSAHDLNPCHHIVQKNNMITILFYGFRRHLRCKRKHCLIPRI